MIYLDRSVALAHLMAEDRFPPDALWGRAGFLRARFAIASMRTSSSIRTATRCAI
jgi:hypothetical protein